MKDYEKYGIEVGQIYAAADGSMGTLKVLDVERFAYCGDVIVEDNNKLVRKIDAFKLAMVRYYLVK